MSHFLTQSLGYPRIGRQRQLKRALEAFWRGEIDPTALRSTLQAVEEDGWQTQLAAGVDRIGVGDATLYDHVLDWADRLGLVPTRFQAREGLDRYFAMARGAEGAPALELTKWFDTNYHYLVPEIEAGLQPRLAADPWLENLGRARGILGERAVPIVLGPVTLLALSRLEEDSQVVLARLLPEYAALLASLAELGFGEVQLHEPALVLDAGSGLQPLYEAAYPALASSGLALNLVTYFDDVGECLPWLTSLPIQVLTLDFTRGANAERLAALDWPADLTLAAGVVDGRNVWQLAAGPTLDRLAEFQRLAPLRISASCSLQFLPYTVAAETALPAPLVGALAFADEKLAELSLLARAMAGEGVGAELTDRARRWDEFRQFSPPDRTLADRLVGLEENDFSRAVGYQERRGQQIELPPFPTTTIGSFPQTPAIRRLRRQRQRGQLDEASYQAQIDAWIAYTIGVQEGLGLDVLVHGEFERSDMVEYFAHKLTGFAFTEHAWVQSYGHRYVRPPILYGDVARPAPMTVREFAVAQSFTSKPVKGMLTGPITILNWSFPRMDVERRQIALQLALALRDEIADLEAAGARVIQVDEPALREGLPFKQERWDEYLGWAVDAFRLATAGASPSTQIHTHMCYAEFGDVLGAIDRLNADVISIENARSDDQTLRQLADYGYHRGVGPGVYDVHSPVIAGEQEVVEKLQTFRQHLEPQRLWVNPDCGLKTRRWEEVLPSLANLVAAARRLRTEAPIGEPALPVGGAH